MTSVAILAPETGIVTVTLPLPPTMSNSRRHWRVTDKLRKQYMERCTNWELLGIGAGPDGMRSMPRTAQAITPPDFVQMNIHMFLGQEMDQDNALSRCKWPIDWLVRARYLVDDKPKHCRLTIPIQSIERNKNRQRVEFQMVAI
jgi:hypothetical protein